MAIQAGPEGQRAAFDRLLAAPALDSVAARAGVENWLAGLIAASLPASDPLVVAAIHQFGWDDLPPGRTRPASPACCSAARKANSSPASPGRTPRCTLATWR